MGKKEVKPEVSGFIALEAEQIKIDVSGIVRLPNNYTVGVYYKKEYLPYEEIDKVREIAEKLYNEAVDKAAELSAKINVLMEFPPIGFKVVF